MFERVSAEVAREMAIEVLKAEIQFLEDQEKRDRADDPSIDGFSYTALRAYLSRRLKAWEAENPVDPKTTHQLTELLGH